MSVSPWSAPQVACVDCLQVTGVDTMRLLMLSQCHATCDTRVCVMSGYYPLSALQVSSSKYVVCVDIRDHGTVAEGGGTGVTPHH